MFIAVPVGMNYRTEKFPVVTVSLIGINTLIFIVTLICALMTDGGAIHWVMQYLWLIPTQSYFWTYLTSMFVHGGILHLLGNMIFLFLFGCCVEDLVGRGKFIAMYLIGGFVAELAYIALLPQHFASEIPMGGASGAISACMGMYLLLRADGEIEFKYFLWFFFVYVRAGEFEVPAWVAIGFWFLGDILGMVIDWSSGGHGGVAFGAHIGGLLAGVAMIGIPKLFQPKKIEQPEPVVNLTRLVPQSATIPQPVITGEIPSIYICDGGQQTGPFTLSQVQSMLRLGSVSPDALYWSEGLENWQNVSELA